MDGATCKDASHVDRLGRDRAGDAMPGIGSVGKA